MNYRYLSWTLEDWHVFRFEQTVPRRCFFCGSLICYFCLVLVCFHARLFVDFLWSPAWKGLISWLSFVMSNLTLSLFHWYPGSGVVLDCIDSWSLPSFLLFTQKCIFLWFRLIQSMFYLLVALTFGHILSISIYCLCFLTSLQWIDCVSFLCTYTLSQSQWPICIIEKRHEISNNVVCATSKGSDEPVHTRSLISAFESRLNILWILSYWPQITWSF